MRRQDGFSLLELLVVVAIIAVLSAIAIPMMRNALTSAHIGAGATDAHVIYTAFKRYHVDHSGYPYASTAPAFELNSFEPLVSGGYYDGRVLSRLVNQEADGYDSPDDDYGPNQEFWLELTLDYDTSVRFLISDSDDAPLGGGAWHDGIFLFRNGVLTEL
ncbi:MAG: prepilin-type N-terminal cleavage/methylation domain-containing protein [Acidobacteriota bacterium]|nr:prepilin-type N-terminal cleavage/methylation domain-containing protein [Acidobacteriota bacterium]MDH3784100.1 prepilin-type N-terminal cleavage/methylation domain-containing protein [Acidobacteriota bacterium]